MTLTTFVATMNANMDWVQHLTAMSDEKLFAALTTETDPNRKTMIQTEITFRGRRADYRQWQASRQQAVRQQTIRQTNNIIISQYPNTILARS